MEFLRQLIAGVAQTWQRLSASARVNIGLAVAATAVFITVLVIAGSRPQYVRLYSRLDDDDAAQIIAILDENRTPYRTQDDRTTILVRVQDRSKVRQDLRTRHDLPRSHGAAPGFELFDKQSVMTSQALQDINYRRAVQGELQKMLNEFEFVKRSTVFIYEEKESLFRTEQKPSKAAITLDVSRDLTKPEIETILGVVSSFGGASLRRENITLATYDGKNLHLPAEDEFTAIANNKLDYRSEYERQREVKAESALAALGVKSVVRVSLDIDFSKVEETRNEALEGTLISSLTTTTQSTSRESLPEGPAGAIANLPDATPVGGGIETTETDRSTTENYEPTMVTINKVRSPGDPLEAKVAVVVEGLYEQPSDEQGRPVDEKPRYIPRTDDELEVYRAVVASAVGCGLTSEQVAIFDHPFDMGEPLMVQPAAFTDVLSQYGLGDILSYLWRLALVVAGFVFVRRVFQRTIVLSEVEDEELAVEIEATPADMRRREIAAEVERASTEQPETVASLIRAWLAEAED